MRTSRIYIYIYRERERDAKCTERKLDGNCTRMLRVVLNKSWMQHHAKQQLYGHLPPILKTIQIRRPTYAGLCWRSKSELISDGLLWTPSHGRLTFKRPARTKIQQLCTDAGCSLEDLPRAMYDMEEWQGVREIRSSGTT